MAGTPLAVLACSLITVTFSSADTVTASRSLASVAIFVSTNPNPCSMPGTFRGTLAAKVLICKPGDPGSQTSGCILHLFALMWV
jgi:hypothetical protein